MAREKGRVFRSKKKNCHGNWGVLKSFFIELKKGCLKVYYFYFLLKSW